MDQRELETRLKALQKAVAEKEPAANIVSILETLKKEVNPTEELLRVRSSFVLRIPQGACDHLLDTYHLSIATMTDMHPDNQGWCDREQAEGEPEQRHLEVGSRDHRKVEEDSERRASTVEEGKDGRILPT